ncbi:hypothetical protein MPTK1_1g07670 [Marchantia polymorpha subsp. ruderalis]|uniref:Uncharacterized protein n=2 Tax=Marchantia polymorpha TaxID=3197 RepID=A0A176W6I8_MARPO|nr:hypothetical protein AXG93_2175s1880 [Marchantia polymorpha subsp. ruderalis]PTQ41004.1 hypothetical protein MARPO_0036s0013 [Marchantia polymorpha]BBM97699.1 hypothetical protein Mp_1g07670 [Marchantia polymorpha subsp. ruderalis]|eukprot:PTQ41004.1 hypothetical protein MARPO_0036s0013 [Marchantia polymorpha]
MDADAARSAVATGSAHATESTPRSLDPLRPPSTARNAAFWFGSSSSWTVSSRENFMDPVDLNEQPACYLQQKRDV